MKWGIMYPNNVYHFFEIIENKTDTQTDITCLNRQALNIEASS